MSLEFYTLTKISRGVYEGLTPSGVEFIVLSYRDRSKTKWAVCAPAREITEPASPTAAALDALASVAPEGWAIASIDHSTRYQARNWTEANL